MCSRPVSTRTGSASRTNPHHTVRDTACHSRLLRPAELQNEAEKVVATRGDNYCGSCYGGLEPEGGCCQTCEQVRQAYINRGWAFGDPDSIEQCKQEGWKEKIQAQMTEGCNVEGRVRVNKVVGSLQFSFGRSFQMNQMSLHDLVPYLRDGNVHDWRHRIQHLYFSSDDEFNIYKAEISTSMKQRLGIAANPLDNGYGHTESTEYMFQYFLKVVSTQFRTIGGDIVRALLRGWPGLTPRRSTHTSTVPRTLTATSPRAHAARRRRASSSLTASRACPASSLTSRSRRCASSTPRRGSPSRILSHRASPRPAPALREADHIPQDVRYRRRCAHYREHRRLAPVLDATGAQAPGRRKRPQRQRIRRQAFVNHVKATPFSLHLIHLLFGISLAHAAHV